MYISVFLKLLFVMSLFMKINVTRYYYATINHNYFENKKTNLLKIFICDL